MNWLNEYKQKSPKQRFLFILGLFFFLLFLVLGLIFIFWNKIPYFQQLETRLDAKQRLYFGILLIVYGTYRFFKLMNKKEE